MISDSPVITDLTQFRTSFNYVSTLVDGLNSSFNLWGESSNVDKKLSLLSRDFLSLQSSVENSAALGVPLFDSNDLAVAEVEYNTWLKKHEDAQDRLDGVFTFNGFKDYESAAMRMKSIAMDFYLLVKTSYESTLTNSNSDESLSGGESSNGSGSDLKNIVPSQSNNTMVLLYSLVGVAVVLFSIFIIKKRK